MCALPRKPLRSVVLLSLVVLGMSRTALAKDISVPLRFDHELIRQALITQVYTAPETKAKLWEDDSGCGFLTLWDPQVDTVDGRLRITSKGEAQVGTPFGETCLAPVQWRGYVEVFEAPVLSEDLHTLQFRIVESNLLDRVRRKGLFTGKIWDLIKQHVHPRFEAVRFDMHAALQDLRDLLPLIVHNDDANRVQEMLDSMRLQDATVTSSGVTMGLGFRVNPSTTPAAPAPEPTLTHDEIERWQTAWQQWDGFITFVVKIFGKDVPARDVQVALRDVLLEARFDIIEALAPQAGVPDPTRALFLKTWERLAPVVRSSAAQLPGSTGLRYLSFIAAGDALSALDQAGPDIGLDISADGLRRLARVLAPLNTEDPLTYGVDVDPELRRLFGFGAPIPPPDLSNKPTDEPEGVALKEEDLPASEPAPPTAQPTPEPPAPTSWLRQLWEPNLAHAAAEQPPASTKLERWVADGDSLDAYLQAVREVLLDAGKKTLQNSDLAPKYHDVYRRIVLTTAWKESCWRQFLRSNGRVTYIKSSVGASGMMQVFEKVWRGLYDVQGLRWDIAYNARAGSEILMHYLNDYAVAKKEDQQPGGIDNLARATYAVYNGGPGHLSRYRRKDTKPALRRIDDLFLEKYRVVSAGQELEVAKCFGGG